MSLRSKLDSLTAEQRRQLMVAFEDEFEQYIELSDGMFIGVNVAPIKHLEVLESAGSWAYGRIKGKGNA